MSKSPDAFRTISEVADWLGVQAHVLRFWESRFSQVKPVKRAGGRRYYRPTDMQLLGGIKKLLHDDGLTIKGVQKILREQGVPHVAGLSQGLDETAPAAETDDGTVVDMRAHAKTAAAAQFAMELESPAADVKMASTAEVTKLLATSDHPGGTQSDGATGDAGEYAPGPLARLWSLPQIDPALLRQMAPVARDLRAWLDRTNAQAAR